MSDGPILDNPTPIPSVEISHGTVPRFEMTSVNVSEPLQLQEVPEIGAFKSYLEKMNQKIHNRQLNRLSGGEQKLTYEDKRFMLPESKLPDARSELDGLMRPDFLRARLLELHHELQALTSTFVSDVDIHQVDAVNKIIKQMEKLDRIATQYMQNQREISIQFKDMGEMKSNIVRIDSDSEEARDRRVIIYGGGYGTDIRGIAPAIQAISSLDRDVVGVSFPDSYRGTVTKNFLEAVKTSDGMEAHAQYFKHVIRQIKTEFPDREIELAGNSTFALVIAHILEDKAFVDEIGITAASCIGSAGAYDVGSLRQKVNYASEILELQNRRTGLAQYAYVTGSSEVQPGQDSLRNQVWSEVKKRTHKRQDAYDRAVVKEGGHIYFVTGGKDMVTKDFLRFTENKGQWVIVHNPNGMHQDVNSDAWNLFRRLFEEQKKQELH